MRAALPVGFPRQTLKDRRKPLDPPDDRRQIADSDEPVDQEHAGHANQSNGLFLPHASRLVHQDADLIQQGADAGMRWDDRSASVNVTWSEPEEEPARIGHALAERAASFCCSIRCSARMFMKNR